MIYRIELEKIRETIEKVKKNPDEAKRVTKMEGTWNTGEGEGSQFEAEVSFEKGQMNLEMTQPTFLGGSGTRPGPMHYCLFGLASCYAATFATIAAMENLHLEGFKIIAENKMDFSRVLGLSENPPIEGVKITAIVKSNAPEDEIKRIEKLAKERCPVVFCITNPLKLETDLLIQ
ncbi:MAG: OsmC family protein [Nitrospirota bacterium]